tara:strand:- start:12806 stop:13102 length:297 start_codon:yes stop_codon:yes gene_type:complete
MGNICNIFSNNEKDYKENNIVNISTPPLISASSYYIDLSNISMASSIAIMNKYPINSDCNSTYISKNYSLYNSSINTIYHTNNNDNDNYSNELQFYCE